MSRSPLVRGVALASLMFVLAACSGDEGGDTAAASSATETPAPATVAVEEYVVDLCTAVVSYRDTLDAGNQAMQEEFSAGSPDLGAAQDALAEFLGQAAAETQALAEEIRALGVPDVEGGEEMALGFVNALEQAEDIFVTTQADVEALPTDDPGALAAGFEEAGTQLSEAAGEMGSTFDDLESQELKDAAADVPECADVL